MSPTESHSYRVQGCRHFYMQGQRVEAGSRLVATYVKGDRPGYKVDIMNESADLTAFVGSVFWKSLLEEPDLGITQVM